MAGSERGLTQIQIFDTTLRDGEQSPGAAMTLEEKLQIAELLDEMGTDVIEAGFPSSSPGDFRAVQEVGKIVTRASVCGLARASLNDIDRAGEALRGAHRPRIHTFISTSPVHMKHKLKMSEDAVLNAVKASVTRARTFTGEVEWSAEDATRTSREFLCRCVDVAIRSGATVINVGDTVGYSTPQEFFDIIAMLRNRVPDADRVIISTHCHDDLGLAVANSLAGVLAGARQVECTINGIGERAGNAALEEIVMSLKVRGDIMPFTTKIDTTLLNRCSKLVSNLTGLPVQHNKAIVGKNAFIHESGIHQDGMLKRAETYEIMSPAAVGVKSNSIVLGKLSGRHAFRNKLTSMGYVLKDAVFEDTFRRFKELADKKKHVFDEDIVALVGDEIKRGLNIISIKALRVELGIGIVPVASLILEAAGRVKSVTASGGGPVDAVLRAIREAYPHLATLERLDIRAVTEGTDAQAQVTVWLMENGRTVTGQASDTDTILASAYAYVKALNKLPLAETITSICPVGYEQ